MNSDERKRFMLFVMLATAIYFIGPTIADRLGLAPAPQPPIAKADKDKDEAKVPDLAKKDEADKKKDGDKKTVDVVAPAAVKKVKKREIKLVDEDKLVLGSIDPKSGYRMQVRFRQSGAGVGTLSLANFEAERVEGKPKHRPLQLIQADFRATPSFSISLVHDAEGVFQASAKQARGKKLYELVQLDENKVVAYLIIPEGIDVSALTARGGRLGRDGSRRILVCRPDRGPRLGAARFDARPRRLGSCRRRERPSRSADRTYPRRNSRDGRRGNRLPRDARRPRRRRCQDVHAE